ncbi:MAG: GMC family oxidoreductase, partial [Deltaproteobacteria bacterium]
VTHLAFQPGTRFDRPLEVEADYVVVGTGAGGAAAAVILARGGASVAMVEAGPWRDPGDYPASMFGTMRDMIEGWGLNLALGRALWPIVQARLVGGTTVINSAIAIRTPGEVVREWGDAHGFPAPDRLADALWRHQDAIEEELHVSPTPPAAAGRSNLLADRAGAALGFNDHAMHRAIRDCAGSGACMQGCKHDRKRSTNVTWIPEALAAGATLLSCAPVARVDLRGRRAVGVSGAFVHPASGRRGKRFRVRARKAVVIAASVTHSPVLLHRSGVRSRALGRGFRAHPGVGVFGVYDAPVDMNSGATQGWSSTALRASDGLKLETLAIPLELVASRLGGAGHALIDRVADYRHLAMWAVAVRAETVGRVLSGPGGKPIVLYDMNRRDMERLRHGAHTLARMHVAAGAKAVLPGVFGLPYSLAPDQLGQLAQASTDPRDWTAIMTHLFGGCSMGADPRRAVCDPQGRVHGYEGLVVADASAIPTTLGVNPQHTIMALARLRAEELLAA